MSNYKNIYKLIDGLNTKIKKMEITINQKKSNNDPEKLEYYFVDDDKHKNQHIPLVKKNSNSNSNQQIYSSYLESYQIVHPKETYSTKKYIGLLFDSNFNNFESDDNFGNKNLLSFIKLDKSLQTQKTNIIISYSIQFELNFTPIDSIICSVAIGIKTNLDSKIKIIKGSKHTFDLTNNFIGGFYTISNTIIYMLGTNEELCVIADLGSNCKVNSKKSLIKILYV